MSKVVLLAPPYLDLYGKISSAAGRYFPLGLAYIASYLRKYGGHEVWMYEPEAQGLSYDDIRGIIREKAPDVIGFTSSTPNFSRAVELARICREESKARIVLGGVHASAIPEFIIESYPDCFDCVVVGEGEQTMLELVDAFRDGRPLAGIKGIVYMDGGRTARTEPRPLLDELDTLPHPARDLIDQGLFAPNAHNARYRKCQTILTSRGCPFNCSFCAARIVSGKKYRMHSAEYVLDEMRTLKRTYGTRQLVITDDTFTLNRERLEKICRGMIDGRLDLAWFCFSQVTAVDRETLKLMKRAGCYTIGFGVESAEKDILRKMGKNINPEQAVEAVHIANEVGLKTQAFYVLGTPGETLEQMEHTIRFSLEVDSTLAFFNMLVPYPGTRDFNYFFSDVSLQDIRWDDFVAIGENCVLTKNATVSKEDVERLIAKASKLYYSDPRRLMRILWHIRTPYELSNYLSGGLGFVKQIGAWVNKKAGG
ncbi:MAG: radical SAM protein [Nitrospirae bacterium]|nr:radical SAM protein [Nitrospirota bacterium]